MSRQCLICEVPITAARLGIDCCRACAVFYKRARTSKFPFLCTGTNLGNCLQDGRIVDCRSCRFQWMEAVFARANMEVEIVVPRKKSRSEAENGERSGQNSPPLALSTLTDYVEKRLAAHHQAKQLSAHPIALTSSEFIAKRFVTQLHSHQPLAHPRPSPSPEESVKRLVIEQSKQISSHQRPTPPPDVPAKRPLTQPESPHLTKSLTPEVLANRPVPQSQPPRLSVSPPEVPVSSLGIQLLSPFPIKSPPPEVTANRPATKYKSPLPRTSTPPDVTFNGLETPQQSRQSPPPSEVVRLMTHIQQSHSSSSQDSATMSSPSSALPTSTTRTTPVIDRIRRGYNLMTRIRKSTELNLRPLHQPVHPSDIEENTYTNIPATLEMSYRTRRVLISALYDFASVAFPEYSTLSRDEKWRTISGCSGRISIIESAYRAAKIYPNEEKIFVSYTTTLSTGSFDYYLSGTPQNVNKDEAKTALLKNLNENVGRSKRAMGRIDPTEEEFLAMIGLSFWTNGEGYNNWDWRQWTDNKMR